MLFCVYEVDLGLFDFFFFILCVVNAVCYCSLNDAMKMIYAGRIKDYDKKKNCC